MGKAYDVANKPTGAGAQIVRPPAQEIRPAHFIDQDQTTPKRPRSRPRRDMAEKILRQEFPPHGQPLPEDVPDDELFRRVRAKLPPGVKMDNTTIRRAARRR
jgi:hypothetical protein